jgi:hypothetical protein
MKARHRHPTLCGWPNAPRNLIGAYTLSEVQRIVIPQAVKPLTNDLTGLFTVLPFFRR